MNALIPEVKRDHLEPLTRKRKALIEAMVWKGLRLIDAAKEAGMTDQNARIALRDPTVMKALNTETQVMRSSAKPRAITRLSELAEQNQHKSAAVMAAKALIADEEGAKTALVNINITPGYAMDLRDGPRVKVIDAQGEDVIRVDGVSAAEDEDGE